ncbi:SDR family NAD(P)-dependent oxidoreductase [Nocardioides sp. GCM10027113]|uniref:SDR family NAD(P)-dependent oxidoreductase n=1 Tax=unclassified Nocardioides TaxID=2615069 RepID=UPI0036136CFB
MLSGLVDTVLDRTVAPGYSRVGLAVRRRLPDWPADPPRDALVGRHVLVTGATSGLGEATASGVLTHGGHAHLVVRDLEKAGRVRDELLAEHPDAEVTVWRCDLGDLEDVRRLARELRDSGLRFHSVVHNAGVMPPERTESPQGHELTMAVHVLGPVLLTDLLQPVLETGARVVLVTSGGMYAQPLRDDDPQYLRGEYSPTTAYARSKRAQVELLGLLQERWTGVDVHATHPGWADTPGVRDSLPGFRRITGPILRDAEGGADTTVWLVAVQPGPPGGGLWHDRRRRPASLLPRTRPSEEQRRRTLEWVLAQTDLG